jgi:osmotically-inducible protein OsmY
MKHKTLVLTPLTLLLAAALSCEKKPASASVPAPDNTARNRGDGDAAAKTPLSQSEASADVAITAAIRRAVMEDKTMPTNAQNCKIITQAGGIVTLRGVVDSAAERDQVGAKARAVAGVVRVDNELEVKGG